MKNRFIPLVAALMLGIAVPAVAGVDFQQVERARKAKQETQSVRQGGAEAPSTATRQDASSPAFALPAEPTAAGQPSNTSCPEHPLVLGLDHGPRAQTTPFQNRQRELRHDAEMAACQRPAAQ